MRKIIRKLMGKTLKKKSKTPFTAQVFEDPRFDIGNYTYGRPNIYNFDEETKLKIGRFCSIAKNVTILLGGEHRIDWVTTYPFNVKFDNAMIYQGHPSTKGDVIIGNDVWIGYDSLILSGVRIGDGAVIGARSVVNSNVPPYSITAGNPAKHLRFRFSESEIQSLLRIAWWNWSLEKIKEAYPLLLAGDVKAFIEKYDVDSL